jgi:hypothetical protein
MGILIWREALQILSGQDRGPNFRNGGRLSGREVDLQLSGAEARLGRRGLRREARCLGSHCFASYPFDPETGRARQGFRVSQWRFEALPEITET